MENPKLTPIFEVVKIKQVVKETNAPFENFPVRSPEDVNKVASAHIADDDREVFLVIVLNTKNQIIALHRAHIGSINASIVHPRDVLKAAILNNGASIAVSHNHPSGNSQPSAEDISATKRLYESCELLGIDLLDHVVVTHTGQYSSMRELGYIF
ncbi:JAB domain-containing protein [Jeotgalibacillus proteolyticus]|uniref:DNA repair protein RadC n=1 Tax=Jeotgalibacillus proteolyticus TaxID=2082395 RepID=A0A2S5G738_9BACL|nr:DNA repair protein RadC [Jeotgalibacillus proteolyticus]PPA68664.1 DNA repair protein RadC [Jeotgalibacillus proteolyticus]PPA68741.1 DNA repair protein RadC [Jeotgalibacillus proteolyticus]